MCFFFFQAEDGIRDLTVTGVQTCALPIYVQRAERPRGARGLHQHGSRRRREVKARKRSAGVVGVPPGDDGWRYLVLRAFRNWDFPQGLVEAHEQPLPSAVRETREEAALDALALRSGASG